MPLCDDLSTELFNFSSLPVFASLQSCWIFNAFDITPVFNHIKNNQTEQKHNSPRCMAQPKQGS